MDGSHGPGGMLVEVLWDYDWAGVAVPGGAPGRSELVLVGPNLCMNWELDLYCPPQVPRTTPGFTEGLWEWDVVELFLRPHPPGPAEDERYLELEFGPGGHWLAMAFAGVRQRTAMLPELEVRLTNEVVAGRWSGRAEVPVGKVVTEVGPPPWRGLLAAVMAKTVGGERLHLCWPALAGPRPDFHQPSRWAVLPGS